MSAPENMNSISGLASAMKNKVDSGEEVKAKLATSQRIIARVTDGIYREPWAAFREMIVNSYDADATRVIVETGAPDFKQVIVRDNGNGMTPEAMAYVLKSIGGSSKRTKIGTKYNTVAKDSFNESPKGRLLIGKIGIGLFAVAQLTQHFQIITKAAESPVRISATIKLKTHDEEISEEGEEEFVAGDVSITSETVHESDTDTHGTTVVLYSLRPEIRRSLQSNDRWRIFLKLLVRIINQSEMLPYITLAHYPAKYQMVTWTASTLIYLGMMATNRWKNLRLLSKQQQMSQDVQRLPQTWNISMTT